MAGAADRNAIQHYYFSPAIILLVSFIEKYRDTVVITATHHSNRPRQTTIHPEALKYHHQFAKIITSDFISQLWFPRASQGRGVFILHKVITGPAGHFIKTYLILFSSRPRFNN